jgi:hypothetical protein
MKPGFGGSRSSSQALSQSGTWEGAADKSSTNRPASVKTSLVKNVVVTNTVTITNRQPTNWPVVAAAPSQFKPWPFWLLLALALLFLVYTEMRRRLDSRVRKARDPVDDGDDDDDD